MRHRLVCDTSALVAYWKDEPGADVVYAQLQRGGCIMHEVNVCELCFTLPRKLPERFTAESTLALLKRVGITAVGGFDREWTKVVADIRKSAPALNIGDGVAVALASALDLPVLAAEKAFKGAEEYAKIELIR